MTDTDQNVFGDQECKIQLLLGEVAMIIVCPDTDNGPIRGQRALEIIPEFIENLAHNSNFEDEDNREFAEKGLVELRRLIKEKRELRLEIRRIHAQDN